MAMKTRYSGEFLSLQGILWRCDILQESDKDFKVGELEFRGEEALVLEWDRAAKEDPVCGSTATVTLISPSDRTYVDLYSIKPAEIRLDVYRNGELFWSGCLDPEFYEEPYESAFGYDVSLTFSDFGLLKRCRYTLDGVLTLEDLIEKALEVSGFNYTALDASKISTLFPDGTPVTPGSLSVLSENFYDEDGEAAYWMDVLEGILQPLALKTVQRCGKVYLYDLNGLCSDAEVREIIWDGDSSTLGTDSVYNNVKVTFSPYAQDTLMDGELEYDGVCGPEWTNLSADPSDVKYNNGPVPTGKTAPECYSYYLDYDEGHKNGSDWDYNLIGFTVFLSSQGEGLAEIGTTNRFCKLLPMIGGDERTCIAAGFYTGGHGSLASGFPTLKLMSPVTHGNSLAIRTRRKYLPKLDEVTAAGFWLKVSLDLLFDPRYNPFEDSGEGNESGNYDRVKSNCQFAFVPVAIVLYDAEGNALCHYTNKWLTENGQPGSSIAATASDPYDGLWGWKDGEASWGDAWLSYYDPEDLVEGSGVLGWKTNRQSVGKPWTTDEKVSKRKYQYKDKSSGSTKEFWMFDSFKKYPEGQYIPYPPQGGYLEIRVYNGVWAFDDRDRFSSDASGRFTTQKLYDKIRWMMYGVPEVAAVKRTVLLDNAGMDDIEYSGELNANAKDPLEIDTVCGTADDISPMSRGTYLRTSDCTPVGMLTRAGVTDLPEQLLIGTLYSQYADRKTTLSGERLSDDCSLSLYSDASQDSQTRFMIAEEHLDATADCSETVFVEVRPDEYKGEL